MVQTPYEGPSEAIPESGVRGSPGKKVQTITKKLRSINYVKCIFTVFDQNLYCYWGGEERERVSANKDGSYASESEGSEVIGCSSCGR
jgi:hypothetical protein